MQYAIPIDTLNFCYAVLEPETSADVTGPPVDGV